MARPRTQDKRRKDLVQAALEAAAHRGLRQLSLTDVAKQAGLTRGALLYYFDDLDALLVEAHAAGNERIIVMRDELVAEQDTPGAKLRVAIDAGLPEGPDDALMRLLYEFDVLAGTSELHDELIERMYSRQLNVYLAILRAGASSGDFELTGDPDAVAMNFVALEDAYGLHIVAGNSLMTVDKARRAIHLYAAQAGCPVHTG